MSTKVQVCTFRVGQFYCGIPISAVQEVIQSANFTRVPLASGAVSGLVAVRGDVLTVIDMRKVLRLDTAPPESERVNVVVRSADEAISLWADAVEEVIELEEDAGQDPPDTLMTEVRNVIRSVYEVGDRLLLLLDPARITDVDTAIR
ncbi:MAG TPA: chemotaxis protein CheW [Mycobacterium sp.]|nr:chemotaxis protein CheW [Mycobacterium sp.]